MTTKNIFLLFIIIVLLCFIFYYIYKLYQLYIKKEYFENKTINDYIDVIYYINLDKREDRKNEFLEEMNKMNINPEKIVRIQAVYLPKQGDLGCSKSHIKTLELFIKSPHKNCIIFEDDFQFTENKDKTNELITNIFKNNIDFDILMLSSNDLLPAENTEYNFLKKTVNSQTTSGYILNKNFAKKLLDNFKEGLSFFKKNYDDKNYCIDIYWKILQPNNKWYVFDPKLGKQRESYSDIQQKITDHKV
jgi:GR25 family glycosyltransferase involved in LPS biosynthesis